jgi:hypothetical protein
MKTDFVTPADIARSVWAVPPLAQGAADAALARHMEAGGIRTILWGGNANVYGMDLGQFEAMVGAIPGWASDDTWAIPAAGPGAGTLRDHARVLRGTRFPAAMPLPWTGPAMDDGLEAAICDFVQIAGIPVILYLRRAAYLPAARIGAMMADGTVCAIKYAVDAPDLAADPWLAELLDHVPADRVVSGDGEIVGIAHMGAHPLAAFTAGAVCIAPRRATAVLRAMQAGRAEDASRFAAPIHTLEGLRRTHGPIPVLHAAVTASGIADMGPLGTPFAPLPAPLLAEIAAAAQALLAAEADVFG